jgi:hypothetical protein
MSVPTVQDVLENIAALERNIRETHQELDQVKDLNARMLKSLKAMLENYQQKRMVPVDFDPFHFWKGVKALISEAEAAK